MANVKLSHLESEGSEDQTLAVPASAPACADCGGDAVTYCIDNVNDGCRCSTIFVAFGLAL